MAAKSKKRNGLSHTLTSIRVGFFLAVRQIARSSKWTNILVICIMTLTFLNLVVVSGILVGLIEGVVEAVRTHYLGDVFISRLDKKPYIERSVTIQSTAENLPGVIGVTARYLESGMLTSDYKRLLKTNELKDEFTATIAGIDPIAEDRVTKLSSRIIEGSYLTPTDYDQVVLGALLLRQYLEFDSTSFPALKNVTVGSRIKVTINGNEREVTVKGIVRSKVDEIDRRVFFVDSQLRGLIGRTDFNVSEIAIRLRPAADPVAIKAMLIQQGFGAYAKIQTQEDAEPKFIKDMKQTFNILGSVISSIGLVVATITIFIVIFINAITRRKYIGILKGVGIHSFAIECAYVFQSLFYALIGTALGIAIVYGFLRPYIDAHPINFPFSDGILVAPLGGTIVRSLILLAATFIAGYIPAKLVTRQNTLDAILNR